MAEFSNIGIKVTLDDSQAKSGLDNIEKKVKSTEKAVKENTATVQKYGSAQKKVRSDEIDMLTKSMKAAAQLEKQRQRETNALKKATQSQKQYNKAQQAAVQVEGKQLKIQSQTLAAFQKNMQTQVALGNQKMKLEKQTLRQNTTQGAFNKTLGKTSRRYSGLNANVGKSNLVLAQFLGVTNRTNATVGILANNISQLVAGGFAARAIVNSMDNYAKFNSQLNIATDSMQEMMFAQEEMIDLAHRNRVALLPLAKLYGAVDGAMAAMGETGEGTVEVLDLFTKALQLSAPTAQEAQSATLQFTQAMGAGVLRGEEFNSIMENGRGVAMALARQLTDGNVGALRTMAHEGKLTSEMVVDALREQKDYIESQFSKVPVTVSQSLQVMRNSGMLFIGSLDEASGASNNLASALYGLAGGLDFLAENMKGVMAVVAASFTPMLISATAESYKNVKAVQAQSLAMRKYQVDATAAAVAANNFTNKVAVASAASARFAATPLGAALTTIGALWALNAEKTENSGVATEQTRKQVERLENELHDLIKAQQATGASTSETADVLTDLGVAWDLVTTALSLGLRTTWLAVEVAFIKMASYADSLGHSYLALSEVLSGDLTAAGEQWAKSSEAIAEGNAKIGRTTDRYTAKAKLQAAQFKKLKEEAYGLGEATEKAAQGQVALTQATEPLIDLQSEFAAQFSKGFYGTMKESRDELRLLGLEGEERARKQAEIAIENSKAMMAWTDKEKQAYIDLRLEVYRKTEALKESTEAQKEHTQTLAQEAAASHAEDMKQLSFEMALLKLNTIEAAAAQAAYNTAQREGSTPEQVREAYEKVKALETEKAAIKSAEDAYNEYRDGLDGFEANVTGIGDAWTETGNKAVDAINSMVEALEEVQEADDKYAEKQKELNELSAENTKLISEAKEGTEEYNQLKEDEQKITEQQKELDEARAENHIKGSMNMLAASVSMYEEGSEAQKAAHTAFMAMRAVELAIDLQKAISAATVAVANQGTGDPYSAFARVAAMAVMMGGVLSNIGATFGIGAGGGGSSAPSYQETQGTGAVEGVAGEKADYMTSTLESFVDMEGDQYTELMGIHREMVSLNSNITNFGNALYRSYGTLGTGENFNIDTSFKSGFDALNNMAEQAATVFGMLDTLAGREFNLDFNQVFDNVGDFFANLEDFVTDPSSWGGGTNKIKETGVQIGKVAFGALLDGIDLSGQLYAIEEIARWDWFGNKTTHDEPYYEDLDDNINKGLSDIMRSASELMIEQAATLNQDIEASLRAIEIYVPRIDLSGLEPEEVSTEVNAVLSTALDGVYDVVFADLLDRFQDFGEESAETIARISQNFGAVSSILNMTNQAFNSDDVLGVSDSLINVAESLKDLKTAADRYYDAFFSEEEKQAYRAEQLTSALDALGLPLAASREGYRALVESLNLGDEAAQEQYVSLMKLSDVADDYYSSLEESAEQLREQARETREQARETLEQLREQARETLEQLRDVSQSYDQAVAAVVRALDDDIQELEQSKSGLEAFFNTLTNGIDGLIGKTQTSAQRFAQAQAVIFRAAETGDYDIDEVTKAIGTAQGVSTTSYATRTDYERDIKLTALAMRDIQGVVEGQMSEKEAALEQLREQRKQYEATTEVLSVAEALENLAEIEAENSNKIVAQLSNIFGAVDADQSGLVDWSEFNKAFEGLASEETLRDLYNWFDIDGDTMLDAVEATLKGLPGSDFSSSVIEKYVEDTMQSGSDAFQKIADAMVKTGTTPEQVAEATGIPVEDVVNVVYKQLVTPEVTDQQIVAWYEAIPDPTDKIVAQAMQDFGISFERMARITGLETSVVRDRYYAAMDGSHADGLAYVPFDGYRAELHRGEAVVPREQADFMRSGQMIAELRQLKSEINMLRSDQSMYNAQIVRNTGETADTLDTWSVTGLPETRV